MHEISTQESQPFDHWKEGLTLSSNPSTLKGRVKMHPAQCPVDETEEFYDPFSELSLFLAKKIKMEIGQSGTPKEWSTRIQNDLMKNILPEFKIKFPKYRLGVFALKKTFEKVSYYYEKFSGKKEALTQDGHVNATYMIRENLRDILQRKLQNDLYLHNEAHRIAVRISECIATLDGERTSLEDLTSQVWVGLKHLVTGIKGSHYKSPFDQFDEMDKLAIKVLIEMDSLYPHLPYEELKLKMEENIDRLSQLPSYPKSQKIAILTSALVGKSFHSIPIISEGECSLLLDYFRERHIRGENSFCAAQRLLHLHGLQKLASTSPASSFAQILNLEIWLMDEEESHILKDLAMLKNLPDFMELASEEAESQLWALIEPVERARSEIELLQIVESEITAQALMMKAHDFKSLVQQTTLSLRKVKEMCAEKEKIKEKAALWALQGELVYSFLHFPTSSRLLVDMVELEGSDLTEIVDGFIAKYPNLQGFRRALLQKAHIYEKYMWYHLKASDSESSFDRFIKRHAYRSDLDQLVREKLPLLPFCPQYAQEQIKSS